jgi:hypothetical protein
VSSKSRLMCTATDKEGEGLGIAVVFGILSLSSTSRHVAGVATRDTVGEP